MWTKWNEWVWTASGRRDRGKRRETPGTSTARGWRQGAGPPAALKVSPMHARGALTSRVGSNVPKGPKQTVGMGAVPCGANSSFDGRQKGSIPSSKRICRVKIIFRELGF